MNKFIQKFLFIVIVFIVPGSVLASAENSLESTELVATSSESSALFKTSNPVYQFINDYEYVLVPFSDAMAGMWLCGPWCGLAAAAVGAFEEGMLYLGHSDKRYLSYGIMGAALGNTFTPNLVYAGAVAGGYMGGAFQACENLVEGCENLAAPAFALSLGVPADGYSGLKWAAAGGMADEVLRGLNITTGHPVTSLVLVPRFLYKTLGTGLATLATVLLNAVVYNDKTVDEILRSQEFKDMSNVLPMEMKNYTRVGGKLYANYDKFIPQEELNRHLEKNVITLFGGQFLTHWLVVKQLLLDQRLVHLFEHLAGPAAAANPILSEGIKVAIFVLPWALGQVTTNSIEKYYDDRLSIVLKNNVQKKIFSGENLLRLSNDGNFSVCMDNLNDDTRIITNELSTLFSSAVSTSVSGAYGVSMIVIHSRSLLVYTFLYQMMMGMIVDYLASQKMLHDQDIKFLRSELLDIYKDSKEHARTITERGGLGITGDRVQELTTALTEAEGKQKLWDMGLEVFVNSHYKLGVVLNYYLVAREITKGNLDFEQRNLLRKSIMDESNMFSWASRNLATVGQIEKALDRIIILEGIIDAPPSGNDQIERVNHEDDCLVLENLEVGVGERPLVEVDKIGLKMGEVYALIGPTGSGKTSLLSKIRGIKENGIYGKGKIYYPKLNGETPKILMLSQQDYFPAKYSLQGALQYPDKLVDESEIAKEANIERRVVLTQELDELRKLMTTLLDKMGLSRFNSDELNLNSKENWHTLLSGGEKKKMLLISAVIKKPGILILDEVFNGLDADSIENIQKILKEYLPNSLILVVDHHAADNNYNFYNYKLSIDDKTLNLSNW